MFCSANFYCLQPAVAFQAMAVAEEHTELKDLETLTRSSFEEENENCFNMQVEFTAQSLVPRSGQKLTYSLETRDDTRHTQT
jgi:hypothetical protein